MLHSKIDPVARITTIACSWTTMIVVSAIAGCGASPQRSSVGEASTSERVSHRGGNPHAHDAPATAQLPTPTGSEEVALAGLLAYADVHSPLLLVRRSHRARAESEQTGASPVLPDNPEIELAAGPRIGRAHTGYELEASISQRLEIAGERGLRLEAADRFSDLAAAEIERARWEVHCDVHAEFHRALLQKERVELSEQILAFQEELLRIVQRKVQAGESAPLLLRLSEGEAAQARQALLASQQEYLAARIGLAQLAGWPVTYPPVPAGPFDEPRDPPSFEEVMRNAATHLPSIRVHEAAVATAQARANLAAREVWPQPSIGARYTREDDHSPEGPIDTIVGTFSVPIPTFQTNQAQRASARAEVIVAEAERDAALRLIEGDVATALSQVAAAAQRVRSYGQEVLPRFEENLVLLRRSFELGEIDLLELSIGRERFLRIQSDALDAQLDYFVALANLERAVGVELWSGDHSEENHL